jgi:uncharacterized protein YndB with AHSA1/START domain
MTTEKTIIQVSTLINAPVAKVWKLWTTPEDITKWNEPSSGWHTPKAQNDLQAGGRFLYRMEAKDGSLGFDFSGVYDKIQPDEIIEYTLDDGRKVQVSFKEEGAATKIVEAFEAEQTHPIDMQRDGWQSILDSFKSYTEKASG